MKYPRKHAMTRTALALLACALLLLPMVLQAARFGSEGDSIVGKQISKAVFPTCDARFRRVEYQLPLKAKNLWICRRSAFEESEVGDGNEM
jgi:hypothetical protein